MLYLGAPPPWRSACVRGAPGVGNATVIGGVIHHSTVLGVTRVRLRRAEEVIFFRATPMALVIGLRGAAELRGRALSDTSPDARGSDVNYSTKGRFSYLGLSPHMSSVFQSDYVTDY